MVLMSIEDFKNNKYDSNNVNRVNQHYVSRGIQKFFSEFGDSSVTCFSRKCEDFSDLKKIRKYSTNIIMKEDNCYELYNIYPNLLEQYFSYYETKLIDSIRNVIKSIEDNYSYSYNVFKSFVFEYLEIFLLFYFRASLTMEYETKKNVKDNADMKVIKDRLLPIINDITLISKLAKTVKQIYKNPILLVSNNDGFLLSDSFITTWSSKIYSNYFSNREIGFYDTNILIPLSSRYYILFSNEKSWLKNNKYKIYNNQLSILNSIIFRNSIMYCVGKKIELERIINNLESTKVFKNVNADLIKKDSNYDIKYIKGNIFEEHYKDDICKIYNSSFDSLKIVKDTYVEFMYKIVNSNYVCEFLEKEKNGLFDTIINMERPKYYGKE